MQRSSAFPSSFLNDSRAYVCLRRSCLHSRTHLHRILYPCSASKRVDLNENYELLQTNGETNSDGWFRHIIETDLNSTGQSIETSVPSAPPPTTEIAALVPLSDPAVKANASQQQQSYEKEQPKSRQQQSAQDDAGWGVDELLPDWYIQSNYVRPPEGTSAESLSPEPVPNTAEPTHWPRHDTWYDAQPNLENEIGNDSQQFTPYLMTLTRTQLEAIMPILPSRTQVDYYQPRSVQERVVQVFGAVGATALFSKFAVLAAPALLYPIWGPYIRAGVRNMEVYMNNFKHVALWRTKVLERELVTYPGFNPYQVPSFARFVIGDPINGAPRAMLEFNYSPGMELIVDGDDVEVLVASNTPDFVQFQVIRELYIPRVQIWLAEYPLVDRDSFVRTSTALL